VQTFLNMLPKYYQFMKRHGRRYLLTRFCGIYQVTLRDGIDADEIDVDGIDEDGIDEDSDTLTIVVMNSVFPAEAAKFLSERFDLKGSTVGRECSVSDNEVRVKLKLLLQQEYCNH
jgi:hypothetical protein